MQCKRLPRECATWYMRSLSLRCTCRSNKVSGGHHLGTRENSRMATAAGTIQVARTWVFDQTMKGILIHSKVNQVPFIPPICTRVHKGRRQRQIVHVSTTTDARQDRPIGCALTKLGGAPRAWEEDPFPHHCDSLAFCCRFVEFNAHGLAFFADDGCGGDDEWASFLQQH